MPRSARPSRLFCDLVLYNTSNCMRGVGAAQASLISGCRDSVLTDRSVGWATEHWSHDYGGGDLGTTPRTLTTTRFSDFFHFLGCFLCQVGVSADLVTIIRHGIRRYDTAPASLTPFGSGLARQTVAVATEHTVSGAGMAARDRLVSGRTWLQ